MWLGNVSNPLKATLAIDKATLAIDKGWRWSGSSAMFIEHVAGGATQAFWSKRCTICADICIHTHKWWLKGREPYGFTCIQGEKVKVSFHMLISSECEWQRTSCVSLRLCLHQCAALCCTAAHTQDPGRKQPSLHKCVLRLTAPVFRQARSIHSTFSLQICPVLFTHCSPTPLHYLFHFSRTSWGFWFSAAVAWLTKLCR